MPVNPVLNTVAVALFIVAAGTAPVAARGRHHHDVIRTPAGYDPAVPRPHQFYPEEVENGVRGNLPFNNQMRKFSDPLNANGGGG